jgi:hypothetical protein
MKRIAVVVGLWALLLPLAAWADGIDITNQFGTVTFTNAGVVSKGSELMNYNGVVAPPGRSLGSVSFSTGALLSGDIWSGGTFSSAGSSFVVSSGGGNYGQPAKGVIFSGTFIGPISWTLVSHTGRWDYVFTLSGTIQGQLWSGRTVTGTTTQTIYAYKNQWGQDHEGGVRLGNTNLAVPEPGTLGMLGTGLIAVAGAMRRKLFGA